jgi:ActR/RegA family two-component response regulator
VSLSTFLVEDNPRIRDTLIAAMQEVVEANFVGFAVAEHEAIAWLETHSDEWQLAVVDLFLAEGNGLRVVDWCKQRRRDQRVVVLTNYATAATKRSAIKLGADAVFDKSTELDAFFDFCVQG